jgi:fructose-bisphosphate aldolase class I
MNLDTESTARTLVADGKGILAADETPATLTKRFDALGIRSTAESRRAYRELLFTTPDAATQGRCWGETSRARSGRDHHRGARRAARSSRGIPRHGRTLREMAGRDPHRRRATEPRVRDRERACAGALCRALSGSEHGPDRRAGSFDGWFALHRAVFQALVEQRVALESMLLKPNMVVPGKAGPRPAPVHEVATATLRCLLRTVPAAVPGIVFLSGGQSDRLATAHLSAINRLPGTKPWKISFSYGRALQDAALEAWHGRDENVKAAQEALSHRGRCNGAASLGRYTDEMEASSPRVGGPEQRHDAHDD